MQPAPGVWRALTYATSMSNLQRTSMRVSALRARGYYSARVTDVVRERDEKDREIAVRVQVDEGTPVHIVRLEFSGLEGLRHELRRELERAQKLSVGDVFDEAHYDDSKAALLAALREASYAKAEVDGQVELDPIRREATVQMVVKLGPPCRFGSLNITLKKTCTAPYCRLRQRRRRAVRPS